MSFPAPAYTYTFIFTDKGQFSFSVTDEPIMQGCQTSPDYHPDWTLLACHQCAPCTLQASAKATCPIACRIAGLVTAFKDITSSTPCTVSCHSDQRTVSKETVVQEGLASILGLLMATSGCPVMDFFRPLARFHLPFASVEESIFRIAATYMLQQFYRQESASKNNCSLDEIKDHYARVKQVNTGILKRIRGITAQDADKNGLVTLASLGQILEFESAGKFESLQYLFSKGI